MSFNFLKNIFSKIYIFLINLIRSFFLQIKKFYPNFSIAFNHIPHKLTDYLKKIFNVNLFNSFSKQIDKYQTNPNLINQFIPKINNKHINYYEPPFQKIIFLERFRQHQDLVVINHVIQEISTFLEFYTNNIQENSNKINKFNEIFYNIENFYLKLFEKNAKNINLYQNECETHYEYWLILIFDCFWNIFICGLLLSILTVERIMEFFPKTVINIDEIESSIPEEKIQNPISIIITSTNSI